MTIFAKHISAGSTVYIFLIYASFHCGPDSFLVIFIGKYFGYIQRIIQFILLVFFSFSRFKNQNQRVWQIFLSFQMPTAHTGRRVVKKQRNLRDLINGWTLIRKFLLPGKFYNLEPSWPRWFQVFIFLLPVSVWRNQNNWTKKYFIYMYMHNSKTRQTV